MSESNKVLQIVASCLFEDQQHYASLLNEYNINSVFIQLSYQFWSLDERASYKELSNINDITTKNNGWL